MKMLRTLFLLVAIPFLCRSQLIFSEQKIDLGSIEEAYELKGDIVITNTSLKKIFLMRADADRGVKIYTSKKTLLPGDTCLLVISFIPEENGKFGKQIKLISSDKETPYQLTLSGNIKHVNVNNRMACVYFGKRKPPISAVKTNAIIVPEHTTKRDNSNKMPGSDPIPDIKPSKNTPTIKTDPLEPPASEKPASSAFTETEYKPNNILFLVDVSSSMRDSLKLPLMKLALHKLIDEARNIDTITLVTYAYKVTVLKEAVSGANKKTLHTLVDSLKAKGMTAGKTAILFSQQLSQNHFIRDGNNQIIIATDGKFKFEREDYLKWKEKQGDKKIILSTVAFGTEKEALKNLKDIAGKGDGSFIHIKTKSGCEVQLLNEIKARSRR